MTGNPILQHSSTPVLQQLRGGVVMKMNSRRHSLERCLLCLMITSSRSSGRGAVRLRPTRPHRRRRRQCRFIANVGRPRRRLFRPRGGAHRIIYIRGGPQTMSALVSGEVPFAQIYGGALVAAGLTGVDTVIVAGLINSPFFSIITTKGIDKPDDLRGKKIGISTFGSATDFALRLALKKWGLKADSEVSILQMRGVPEILPAMASGALHGGVMSPPTNMMAIRAGFKELAYLPQIGISFQHTTVATTRRYLEKNRPVSIESDAGLYRRHRADQSRQSFHPENSFQVYEHHGHGGFGLQL